jgi:hypothetical protein
MYVVFVPESIESRFPTTPRPFNRPMTNRTSVQDVRPQTLEPDLQQALAGNAGPQKGTNNL